MGRPCRCCRPKMPDSVLGRCPCTPWEITVDEAGGYNNTRGISCDQEWFCLDDGKEGGDQDLVNACDQLGSYSIKYWAPEVCEPTGELQEYAGYVKLPPSPQCVKNPDDPSSLNTPKCDQASFVISKIIHIGIPATVEINLQADSQAGECKAQARNESISYEAEPGWYEIAYSYSEIIKSKQVWGTSGGQTMYDANGEISAHSSGEGTEGWREVFDDYATPVHAAYIRKFVVVDHENPNLSFGADPNEYRKEVTFSNPADKKPAAAAERIICCSEFECQEGTFYGTSPLVDDGLSADVVPWDVPNIYMKFGGINRDAGTWTRKYDRFYAFGTTTGEQTSTSTCNRVETFSAITHFEGALSAEARIAAFEFTFTPGEEHESDIWPEGSEEHKKALDVLDSDIIQKTACGDRHADEPDYLNYTGVEAHIARYWGGEWVDLAGWQEPEDFNPNTDVRPADPAGVLEYRRQKKLGCLCFSDVWDANGTLQGYECIYKGCQSLTPKDVRTLWEYNPDEARKALCPEPEGEVIDCEQQFVETNTGDAFTLDDEGITTHSFDAAWRMTGDASRHWLSDVKPPRQGGFFDAEGNPVEGPEGVSDYAREKKTCQEFGYGDVRRGQPPCGRGAWRLCYKEGCFDPWA